MHRSFESSHWKGEDVRSRADRNHRNSYPSNNSDSKFQSNRNYSQNPQNNMVMSKMQPSQQPGASPSVLKSDVVAFIREYKVLECSCCEQLMGFQHRVTGALVCKQACIEEIPDSTNGRAPQLQQQQQNEKPYRHVSSLHKYEGPSRTSVDAVDNKISPVPAKLQQPIGQASLNKYDASPRTSFDAVINKVPAAKPQQPVQQVTGQGGEGDVNPFLKYTPSAKAAVPVQNIPVKIAEQEIAKVPAKTIVREAEKLPECIKEIPIINKVPVSKPQQQVTGQGGEMILAEAIRKDVNPFFKNIPSAKAAVSAQNIPKSVDNIVEQEVAQVPVKTVAREAEKLPEARYEKAPPRPTANKAPPRPASSIPQAKYTWMSCRFSPTLENGVDVKTTYVWGITKYQVCAATDEPTMIEFQEKIQAYALKQKPMTRKPVKDEIVLGLYGEEYYRGRVVDIKDNGCELVFVDYGDKAFYEFNTLVEPNDEIMEPPIWSVTISLIGLPKGKDLPKLKAPKGINELVFGPLQLEVIDELKVGPQLDYEGKLWVSSDNTLNNVISDLISSRT